MVLNISMKIAVILIFIFSFQLILVTEVSDNKFIEKNNINNSYVINENSFEPLSKNHLQKFSDLTNEIFSYNGKSLTQYLPIIFTPDGREFLYLNNKLSFTVVNLYTGITNERFPHSTEFNIIEFSPDGKILATGGGAPRYEIYLWDFKTGGLIATLSGHEDRVRSLAFSKDSLQLVSGGEDNKVVIWDVLTGVKLVEKDEHKNWVSSVSYSSDGNFLATGDFDNNIYLRDSSGMIINNLTGHNGPITSLSFSEDNTKLISSSKDSKVIVWNNLTSLDRIEFSGHNASVEFAYFINKTTLISGTREGNLEKWNFVNNISTSMSVNGIKNIISSDLYPDCSLLSLGSRSGAISLINLNSEINPEDNDLDGMDNTFESAEGLDPNDILDKFADNDNDGLANILEYNINSNINNPDTDGDGMNDLFEYIYNLNLNLDDSGDDPDGDRLINIIEHDYGLNPLNQLDELLDLDQDGIPNRIEIDNGLNPLDSADGQTDKDGDGIPNQYEYSNSLFISLNDSHLDKDGDGMDNLWEYQMGLNAALNDSFNDQDLDGLTNLEEYEFKSWANQSDSDLDGINDLNEFLFGLNATNFSDASDDIDNDGVSNKDEINNGSNPRDFFSVPLISLSYIHLFVAISILGVAIAGYYYNQKVIERRKALSLEEQEEVLQSYMKNALEAVEEKKEDE